MGVGIQTTRIGEWPHSTVVAMLRRGQKIRKTINVEVFVLLAPGIFDYLKARVQLF